MHKLTTLEKDLSCATRTRLPFARLSFKDPNRSSLVKRAICLSRACVDPHNTALRMGASAPLCQHSQTDRGMN